MDDRPTRSPRARLKPAAIAAIPIRSLLVLLAAFIAALVFIGWVIYLLKDNKDAVTPVITAICTGMGILFGRQTR